MDIEKLYRFLRRTGDYMNQLKNQDPTPETLRKIQEVIPLADRAGQLVDKAQQSQRGFPPRSVLQGHHQGFDYSQYARPRVEPPVGGIQKPVDWIGNPGVNEPNILLRPPEQQQPLKYPPPSTQGEPPVQVFDYSRFFRPRQESAGAWAFPLGWASSLPQAPQPPTDIDAMLDDVLGFAYPRPTQPEPQGAQNPPPIPWQGPLMPQEDAIAFFRKQAGDPNDFVGSMVAQPGEEKIVTRLKSMAQQAPRLFTWENLIMALFMGAPATIQNYLNEKRQFGQQQYGMEMQGVKTKEQNKARERSDELARLRYELSFANATTRAKARPIMEQIEQIRMKANRLAESPEYISAERKNELMEQTDKMISPLIEQLRQLSQAYETTQS